MTSDQTPDPAPAATPPAPGVDLGQWLMNAVVATYFSPSVVGVEMTQSYGPNGPVMVPQPKYGLSPLGQTAQAIYFEKRDEITKRISEKIDVAELADKIAEKVIDDLSNEKKHASYGRHMTPAGEQIQRMVRDRLADHYTGEAIARYDAEQAAMRAAWDREQRRAAEAPPQIEGGAGEHDA